MLRRSESLSRQKEAPLRGAVVDRCFSVPSRTATAGVGDRISRKGVGTKASSRPGSAVSSCSRLKAARPSSAVSCSSLAQAPRPSSAASCASRTQTPKKLSAVTCSSRPEATVSRQHKSPPDLTRPNSAGGVRQAFLPRRPSSVKSLQQPRRPSSLTSIGSLVGPSHTMPDLEPVLAMDSRVARKGDLQTRRDSDASSQTKNAHRSENSLNEVNNLSMYGRLPRRRSSQLSVVKLMVNKDDALPTPTEDELNFGWGPLLNAAREGNARLVLRLLNLSAGINQACKAGNTALHIAARSGHVDCVRLLVSRSAQLDAQNHNGWSALMYAAITGNSVDVLAALGWAGANVDLADENGRTALMWAARHGFFDGVISLAKFQADIQKEDAEGICVLDHASAHLAIRSALLALSEWNLNLMSAIKRNDVETMLRAIRSGAQVDHMDDAGLRPLAVALLRGSISGARLLTRFGANPDLERARMLFSETPRPDQVRVMEALTLINKSSTQLFQAARSLRVRQEKSSRDGEEIPIVRIVQNVLEASANVNFLDQNGKRTAIMVAAGVGDIQAMKLLIKARADLGRRDVLGWSVVHHAVLGKHSDALVMLLKAKTDFHVRDYEGTTPLHVAVAGNDSTLVQILSAIDCDVNERNLEGKTPVQVAVQGGRVEALRALWGCRADVTVQDDGKRSLVHIAVANGHLDTVAALLHGPTPLPGLKLEAVFESSSGSETEPSITRQSSTSSFKSMGDEDRLPKQRPPSIAAVARDGQPPPRSSQLQTQKPRDPTRTSRLSNGTDFEGDDTASQLSRSRGKRRVSQASNGGLKTLDRRTQHADDSAGRKEPITSSISVCTGRSSSDLLTLAEERRVAYNQELPVGLPNGEILSLVDDCGWTALMLAASSGRVDILDELLDKKAQVDRIGLEGNTALLVAAQCGRVSALDSLIKAGADIDIKNDAGKCAADYLTGAAKQMLHRETTLKVLKSKTRTLERPHTGKVKCTTSKHRARFDNLPKESNVDFLEARIIRLLRVAEAEEPELLHVPVNPITQLPLGHAFVEYLDLAKLANLLRLNGEKVFGSVVYVSLV